MTCMHLNAHAGRDPVAVDLFVRAAGDEERTPRGGSWYDRAHECRSAVRDTGGDVRCESVLGRHASVAARVRQPTARALEPWLLAPLSEA